MTPFMTRCAFLTAAAGTAATSAGLSAALGQPGGMTLCENGTSPYQIVRPADASPSQIHASEELKKFISAMTGVTLPIISDAEALPEHAILLGKTRHSAGILGEEPDLQRLGPDGFTLRTAGPHLLIIGGPVRGTLYGVYELLEKYCGCRWYATFHSLIPSHSTLTLPAISDTQTPAFAMREPYWYEMLDGDMAARNRVNGSHMRLDEKHGGKIRFGGGLSVHTFYRLVPPGEFFEEHPEYFSEIEGKRQIGYSQLCLTNADVLRIVTERVLDAIRKDPGAKLFSVSQNDWDGHCTCENCMVIEKREESPAGPLIEFVNKVAEAVEKEFPDVWIETLAYQYTRQAPKHVRLRHNVVPRLCTIECDFSLPLDVSAYKQNRRLVNYIEGWSAVSDKLYVWDYTTNFHNYIGPHPNFNAIPGNVRFFRDNHVVGLFEQGAAEGPHAEFSELRGWVLAKLLWDPDQSVEALYDDFFAGYYGPAAGPIREYFDELQTLPADPNVTLRIFDSMRNRWLTMEFVERAEELWAQAEELAAGDEGLLYRVRMSGIPVLWARTRLMDSPQRQYVLADDTMTLADLDPAYRNAGQELLGRIREGKVRIREYNGYHTQELIDLTGQIEGFPLTSIRQGDSTAATATGLGGGVLLWEPQGGPNLLVPELGGLEVVDRHAELERPDFAEYDLLETTADSLALRIKKPIAIWGPQLEERLGIDRTIRLDQGGPEFTNTYSMKQQTREVSPAIRIALDMPGARRFTITISGGQEMVLEIPDGKNEGALELPEAALSGGELQIASAAGRRVQVTLPGVLFERISLEVDTERGHLLVLAVLPKRDITPDSALTLTVHLRLMSPADA